jgi:tellurite methyltransferase
MACYDWNPVQLLKEYISLLPRGLVLDIAMGQGRNALYLAQEGFTVGGVDSDEEAIKVCQKEAAKRGVTVKARCSDLTNYHIAPETYDVILCFYYLQRDLIPLMKAGLKDGGYILYETFLIDQHLAFGKPRHREYCFERNELLHLFSKFRVLFYREGFVSREKALASLVAQKC